MKRTAMEFFSSGSICDGTAPEITCTEYTKAYISGRAFKKCRTIWTDGEGCFYILLNGFFVEVSLVQGNIWRIAY